MNKLYLGILLTVTIPFLLGSSQEAFAGVSTTSCESKASGLWTQPNTWNCNGDFPDFPNSSVDAIILPGDTVTVAGNNFGDFVVVSGGDPKGTLIINQGASLTANLFSNIGDTFNSGTLTTNNNFINDALNTFHNQCTGVVNINSDTLPGTNGDGFKIINHGVFNLVMNFNNFGLFQNSGTINGGNIVNQGNGVLEQIPSICTPVGGIKLPIDTTALLLASAQSMSLWIIPVIVSAIGIGIVIARKF